MKTINRVELKGIIGQEPQVNTVGNNRVANFSVATKETWKDKNGDWQEDTDWHSVCAWEGFGIATLGLLHKGTKVHIIGRLRTRKYTDQQGVDRYITEIIASELDMIDEPRNNQGETGAPSPGRTARAAESTRGGYASRQQGGRNGDDDF